MKIALLAAGAAGMYCGSCIRDNTLARALIESNQEALLIPLYTPLRLDRESVEDKHLFYGGINVFLQQKYPFFRKTPRILDAILDFARVDSEGGALSSEPTTIASAESVKITATGITPRKRYSP